ncbi:MAG: hypothetical protein ACON42_06980 [Flavobacteriaceae bacterium]
MENDNLLLKDFVSHLERKIKNGTYKDSVHKITLMTTLSTIEKTIREDF